MKSVSECLVRLKRNLWSRKRVRQRTHFHSDNERITVFTRHRLAPLHFSKIPTARRWKRKSYAFAKCWLADKWAGIEKGATVEFTGNWRTAKKTFTDFKNTAWKAQTAGQWTLFIDLYTQFHTYTLLHSTSKSSPHTGLQVDGLSPAALPSLNHKFCLTITEWPAYLWVSSRYIHLLPHFPWDRHSGWISTLDLAQIFLFFLHQRAGLMTCFNKTLSNITHTSPQPRL